VSAHEPSSVYPAGCVGMLADPNIASHQVALTAAAVEQRRLARLPVALRLGATGDGVSAAAAAVTVAEARGAL
jgi:hypothetical protein